MIPDYDFHESRPEMLRRKLVLCFSVTVFVGGLHVLVLTIQHVCKLKLKCLQAAVKSLHGNIDDAHFLRFLDRQVVAPSQSVRFFASDSDRGAPCTPPFCPATSTAPCRVDPVHLTMRIE
jgi:hypothetical protein